MRRCTYGRAQSWERDGTGQKCNQACQNVLSKAPDTKPTDCAQDRAIRAYRSMEKCRCWRRQCICTGNTPVEVPESANRTFAFGRVKSRDKALGANEHDVANIEDGMADNDNLLGDNDGEDGTMSRGTVNSTRVEGMPLTGEGQRVLPEIKNQKPTRIVWATSQTRRATVRNRWASTTTRKTRSRAYNSQ